MIITLKSMNFRWGNFNKHKKSLIFYNKACGAEWIRTTDSRIFSPMLYQLSYSTVIEWCKSRQIIYPTKTFQLN